MSAAGSLPPDLPTSHRESEASPAPSPESNTAGRTINNDRGRIFPCENCGADMEFHIGQQTLVCRFCQHSVDIQTTSDDSATEKDYAEALKRIRQQRQAAQTEQHSADDNWNTAEKHHQELRCESCGGNVEFYGTLTSTHCPYCGVPIQLEKAHRNEPNRIPVDGLIPFRVEKNTAQNQLAAWVRSRWFAPNSFLKDGVSGRFNGVYLAYFTYDSLTWTAWSGQRGDVYTVSVGTGNNRRTETRVRWSSVSGEFQRFFDNIPVLANSGMNREFIQALEPWPLHQVVPFQQQYLAGLLARTYDIELDAGFREARARMDAMIAEDVRGRIGGDRQSISSIQTQLNAVTFRHLLLPVWLMAYRFHGKTYQIFINAATGEVQGQRPYSVWKITFTSLLALIATAFLIYWIMQA